MVAVICAVVDKGAMDHVHAAVLRRLFCHTGPLHLRRAGGAVHLCTHMYAPRRSYPRAFRGSLATFLAFLERASSRAINSMSYNEMRKLQCNLGGIDYFIHTEIY